MKTKCCVCGKETIMSVSILSGESYPFCSKLCFEKFDANDPKYDGKELKGDTK